MLYDVPVDLLLPEPDRKPWRGASGPTRGASVDLDAQIESISGPERELLRRFVRMIQAQRRDNGGIGNAIRSEDIRAIELLLGSSRPAVTRRPDGRSSTGLTRGLRAPTRPS